ncbi:hypothetical protein ACFQ68_16655 [Amycolatopsis japonica]|uniref:hypothetical protein n=1 Tax=Amycolatopsis japonica TaxID=208439 RepID=UPI00366E1F95
MIFHLTRSSADSGQVPRSGTATASLTAQEAESLAIRLTSGDVSAVRSVITVSAGQDLDAAAIAGLASLKPLTFDLASFQDTGESTSTVVARSSDGARWTVQLVLVDDAWKVSTTEPVR